MRGWQDPGKYSVGSDPPVRGQITRMRERMSDYSAKVQQMGMRRILSRVSEAYGRMILIEGLFQARVSRVPPAHASGECLFVPALTCACSNALRLGVGVGMCQMNCASVISAELLHGIQIIQLYESLLSTGFWLCPTHPVTLPSE